MTRTWVLHPDLRERDAVDPSSGLAEAVGLTRAIDLDCVGGEVVPLREPQAGYLFGSGKRAELKARFAENEIELVIINGTLSPVQQRNLERDWNLKILDRTGLILEIFGERAATREGVMQVELAYLNYQKSRLVRSWTHLERQRGGTGFIGGPGETQIEADRRALDERILKLKKQLQKVVRTRTLHRAARKKVPHPVVALVGYTNAGKSTLFNRLTDAEVLAEDMLFATLDPTMRQLKLPSGRIAILSDTVGFISDLPTQLVAAFRATLEEVLEADLIVHVRDAAHPATERQRQDVLGVLRDLGIGEVRIEGMIEALNKIDLMDADRRIGLGTRSDAFAISAVTGEGVDRLLAEIEARLFGDRFLARLVLRHDDGAALAWLHRHADVQLREESETDLTITAEVTKQELAQFQKAFGDISVEIGARVGKAAQ